MALYEAFTCMKGTRKFTELNALDIAPSLQFTAVLDAAMVTLLEDYHRTAARLLIRLQALGAVIHDAVTERFRWDLSGIIKDVSAIGSQNTDGKLTVQVTVEDEDDDGLPGGSGLAFAAETVTATEVVL